MQALNLTAEQLLRGWQAGAKLEEGVVPPDYYASEFRDRPDVDNPSDAARRAKGEEETFRGIFRKILTRAEAARGANISQQQVESAVAVLKRTFGVPDVIFADFGSKGRIKTDEGQSVSLAVFIPGVWIDDYNGRDTSPRSSIFRWVEADDLCRSPGVHLARMQDQLERHGGSVDLSGRAPFKRETMGQPVDPKAGEGEGGDDISPGSNEPEDLDAMSKKDLVDFAAEMTPPLELNLSSKKEDLRAAIDKHLADGAKPRDPSPPVE